MLTDKDAKAFYRAGFTREEIDELRSSREQVNASSPAWKAALTARRKYSADVRTRYSIDVGLTLGREAYDRQVNQRRPKNSPWEFLKKMYIPKAKVSFARAAKKRAQSRTAGMMKLARR